MRFVPTDEQVQLADAVDDVVQGAGGPSVARAWGAGDAEPATALWSSLAEMGILGLRTSEDEGGVGGSTSDLAVVFERLGYHAVPGPYIESIALLPALVDAAKRAQIASGEAIATAAVDGLVPYALDADLATDSFLVSANGIAPGEKGERLVSIDRSRHLFRLTAGESVPVQESIVAAAIDEATLASSAFLVGAAERMLADAVAYVKTREQFGRPIGEYQAIKHALANVRVAVTFARPLVQGAAIAPVETSARSISAAKVSAGQAALLSARTALQVHGAIGYTEEYDLSLWLLRVRALVGSWGTPTYHRARIAASIGATA